MIQFSNGNPRVHRRPLRKAISEAGYGPGSGSVPVFTGPALFRGTPFVLLQPSTRIVRPLEANYTFPLFLSWRFCNQTRR